MKETQENSSLAELLHMNAKGNFQDETVFRNKGRAPGMANFYVNRKDFFSLKALKIHITEKRKNLWDFQCLMMQHMTIIGATEGPIWMEGFYLLHEVG